MNKIFKNIANQKVINSKDKKLSQDWGKGMLRRAQFRVTYFSLLNLQTSLPLQGFLT